MASKASGSEQYLRAGCLVVRNAFGTDDLHQT
jgi:hypothetical protein